MRVFESITQNETGGLGRRGFLRLAGAAALCAAFPSPGATSDLKRWGLPTGYTLEDLRVSGGISNRAVVVRPKKQGAKDLPVLVLIHGLAETRHPRDGVYAWVERYGLGSSLARLVDPPVERGLKKRRFLTRQRAEVLNERLARHPLGDVLLVCPYAPNMYKMATRRALDRYADWIGERLLPKVRERFGGSDQPGLTAIDGCSFGGFVSFEVFARRPELFGAVGGIQAAVGERSVSRYVSKFAAAFGEHGAKPVFLATSSRDPYRDAIATLAKKLKQEGLGSELITTKGPHGPRWLAEVGVLEMLAWHDAQFRELKSSAEAAPGAVTALRAGGGR